MRLAAVIALMLAATTCRAQDVAPLGALAAWDELHVIRIPEYEISINIIRNPVDGARGLIYRKNRRFAYALIKRGDRCYFIAPLMEGGMPSWGQMPSDCTGFDEQSELIARLIAEKQRQSNARRI